MTDELKRRGPDDPMRRFRVDCRVCQGAGAECRACGGKGTEIIELDESDFRCEDFDRACPGEP